MLLISIKLNFGETFREITNDENFAILQINWKTKISSNFQFCTPFVL